MTKQTETLGKLTGIINKYFYMIKKTVLHSTELSNHLIQNMFAKKMDRHTGGKWLIQGLQYHTENQSQSLKHPCRLSKASRLFAQPFVQAHIKENIKAPSH